MEFNAPGELPVIVRELLPLPSLLRTMFDVPSVLVVVIVTTVEALLNGWAA